MENVNYQHLCTLTINRTGLMNEMMNAMIAGILYSSRRIWKCFCFVKSNHLCWTDADKATVPPAGGDMGAAAHGGHLHKEAASHH